MATTNAMAALWLLPKVAAFQQNNEGVDLRILTTDNISDLHKMDFDLALFYCRVPPAGMRVTTLFPEEVFLFVVQIILLNLKKIVLQKRFWKSLIILR